MNRGFTLVELMITVVIIAVLAVVAMGSYKKYTNKGRTAEVMAMIGEFKIKEEAYRAENTQYLSSTTIGENDFYPALVANHEPSPKTITNPARWTSLGIQPQRSQLYCGYVAVAGPASSWSDGAVTAGTEGRTLFNNVTPTVPWFYVRATCDNDNNPATNATWLAGYNSTVIVDKNTNK